MNKKTLNLIYIILIFVALVFLVLFIRDGKFGIANSAVFQIRSTKIIMMCIGSFAIGASSYLLQRFTRNNIIGTGFFGISSFNILFVVVLYVTFSISQEQLNLMYRVAMPFVSIGASGLVVAIIYFIARNRQGVNKGAFILSGILLNYLFGAISYGIIKYMNPNKADSILSVTMGGVNEGYSSIMMIALAAITFIASVWYLIIYKKINAYSINEKLSINLGNNNRIVVLQTVIIVALFAAVGFSSLGSISFLGLMAGNTARRIFKNKRYTFILAGVCAMIVLLLSHLIFISILGWYYPIGIISSLISIPYFIYLILRRQNA